MKILLILGHPKGGSFNHALAQVSREAVAGQGHEVWFHDLYAEGFDPLVPVAELAKDAPLPTVIQQHADEVSNADGIVIVHPNWWCQPPAILKGWIDRVLRSGKHYRFEADGKGGSRAVGLLKAKAALVVTTANNPQEKEIEVYGDPLEVFWRKVVFGLCGVPNCHRLIFTPVILSSFDQRQQWLKETRMKIAELFPRS